MTNQTPPEIDPTYLTDNYPDYYCCKVIRSQTRLKDMVADALVSGTLDISYCIIDVEFNLYRLEAIR